MSLLFCKPTPFIHSITYLSYYRNNIHYTLNTHIYIFNIYIIIKVLYFYTELAHLPSFIILNIIYSHSIYFSSPFIHY